MEPSAAGLLGVVSPQSLKENEMKGTKVTGGAGAVLHVLGAMA